MTNSYISYQMLRPYIAALPNRDESNEPKQNMVGEVNRSRISSQCMTRAIRKAMNVHSIHTAHLEDLVGGILEKFVADGVIAESDVDVYGKAVCDNKSGIFGGNWSKRAKAGKGDDTGKGNVVYVTSMAELTAVIKAIVDAKETDAKKVEKIALDVLKDIRVSADEALFGTTVTAGVKQSVNGAVCFSDSYSIDEYRPESDFVTANFLSDAKADVSDPFFACLSDFENAQAKRSGADAMTSSWEYSNTMFTNSNINVDVLKENLSRNVLGDNAEVDAAKVLDEVKALVAGYSEAFVLTVPESSQHSRCSKSRPAIVYIEAIKNGSVQNTYFNKAIRNRQDKGIVEQGIENILEFAVDDTFRKGDIHKFVMLDGPYKEYGAEFEKQGVQVIHNLNELEEIMKAETERIAG